MAQITETRFHKLQEELEELEKTLSSAIQAQERAADMGDLSENAEYHAAKEEAMECHRKIAEITEELRNAEIIQKDYSSRISLGSMVDVTQCTKDGEPLEPTRRFVLETKGDTVIAGVLSVASPLGSAIINGTDGIFRVVNNGGMYYKVTKVIA